MKLSAWIIFIACLLVLSLSATPYSRTANYVLIGARLVLLTVLSILAVREWWKKQKDDTASAEGNESLLARLRRWYHDEPKDLRAKGTEAQ